MTAIAVAPGLGFWVYRFGWGWLCAEVALLNLVMFAIAWRLEDLSTTASRPKEAFFGRHMVEWGVLWVAMALFLCSFGYGGITSFVAVLAEENGIKVQKNLGGGTDASIIQRNRTGARACTIGAPTRYMHSTAQMCSKQDIESTIELLVVFLENAHRGDLG